MNGFIANTDHDWYTFLASQGPTLDEVNFWQPSGGHSVFRALAPGEPFFFRLKAPHNAIAGFGWFARHEQRVRSSLAWEAFGIKNGAPSLEAMRRRIEKYTRPGAAAGDPVVGCLMIAQPVFFGRAQWVEEPVDWKKNIVSGKGYDLEAGEGRRIFQACLARVPRGVWPSLPEGLSVAADADSLDRYGPPTVVEPRIGQGIFRVALTSAYQGACAVTGEHSGPVLEAAHIRPYSDGGVTRSRTASFCARTSTSCSTPAT